ncbi:hypothetical protein Cob_v000501 [Colletotrichum orbiculare MAFF 240422]|uniref:Uncharacterized protein n=1 Tax=Colletotrichum orbiculare (strain 104-T / ATCC 96160 / CBS 514.97 / LARS 414 / MAFF 240422) TaxID=1213857 RepID=A0A484G6L6_COLOR|nr:hypothetical protein Cob_v000501 [Colletotrichum orbiculare MAFF 240422]
MRAAPRKNSDPAFPSPLHSNLGLAPAQIKSVQAVGVTQLGRSTRPTSALANDLFFFFLATPITIRAKAEAALACRVTNVFICLRLGWAGLHRNIGA